MARPITALLHTFIADTTNWRGQLFRNWNSIVGALHTRMCLEKIHDDGTLLIGVHDSRWMQELFYLSQEVVQTINKQLGQERVTRVRFILSSTHHNPQKRSRRTDTHKPQHQKEKTILRTLTAREQQALQRIEDPQLQEILSQIMQQR